MSTYLNIDAIQSSSIAKAKFVTDVQSSLDNADDAENASNKVTSFQTTPDDTHYPSEKLVYETMSNKPSMESVSVSPSVPDTTVYTKGEVNSLILNKQNILVSGQNIKTVNGSDYMQ